MELLYTVGKIVLTIIIGWVAGSVLADLTHKPRKAQAPNTITHQHIMKCMGLKHDNPRRIDDVVSTLRPLFE